MITTISIKEKIFTVLWKEVKIIQGILELIKESEHPRTYECYWKSHKTRAEVTEKLGDLQEKILQTKKKFQTHTQECYDTLFVGSIISNYKKC